MTKDCFIQLCNHIEKKIGKSKVKSESYINEYLRDTNSMFMANQKTTSGYISGEIKLAITLRLLAGDSSYDIGVLFDICSDYCNTIMFYVLKHWIINLYVGDINFKKMLEYGAQSVREFLGFSQFRGRSRMTHGTILAIRLGSHSIVFGGNPTSSPWPLCWKRRVVLASFRAKAIVPVRWEEVVEGKKWERRYGVPGMWLYRRGRWVF